jgi:stage II sporulation protein E
MAEWATLKAEKIINRFSDSLGIQCLIVIGGFLTARANLLGIYPFAVAYLAVLGMNMKKWILPGLTGIAIGLVSVQDFSVFLEVMPSTVLGVLAVQMINEGKNKILLLAGFTALGTLLPGLGVSWFTNSLGEESILLVMVQSIVAAGFSIIFFFAFLHKGSLMKGSFKGEQGMVWILVLAVCLSGLQGLTFGKINLQITFMGFFLLFVAYKYGAGSAAGVGAILGFLLKWNLGIDNLIDAGLYSLLGFMCGGFIRFGKIGVAAAYSASILMASFFVNETFLTSHLYSSALALLMFFLLPGKHEKSFLKNKVMPEIETTVSKVKTVGDLFDQLAYGFQAAGLESRLQPEVPEMMNTLVDKICRNCPDSNYCWQQDFHQTYHFMYDLFAYEEKKIQRKQTSEASDQINQEKVPAEWGKCSKLEEVILAAQFILEQEKDKEVWQKRLAINREALAGQYRSVSQVIGHLAQELHSQHNHEDGKPLVWSRKHKLVLDLGIGSFIKTGNGISGDNFSSVSLSSSKNALIICDGMGAGEEAARMSSAALTILEQLLSTGFEPESAIKALNSILVLRSPEESFVTVDMAVLNIEANQARLIKIGAAPTYIISRNKVDAVKTSSLPAGILNDIDIPAIDIPFKDETLVIVTDGILDVAKRKDDWLKEYLKNNKSLTSQDLADSIVKEARRLSGDCLEDDGVVLVVKRKDLAGKDARN